jgi:hypothetical protein
MTQGGNEQDERSPFDFSPFDAQANLDALCDIIRTIRNLSWSYAGDIYRTVKRIGQTFDAGRCVIFVLADDNSNHIDVFEHVEPPLEPLHAFFESTEGQQLLKAFLESGNDWIDSTTFAQFVDAKQVSVPRGLMEPVTYVFPLRNQHASRYSSVKPGLLLMQEPHGLARWNRRLVDSLVVVTEYLAMVIECERLASAAARDAANIGGVLAPRKFKEYGEREIMRGKELSDVISLVVLGVPSSDEHRPAVAQMKTGFMPGLAAQLLEFVSAFDLVCQWNEEMVLVLLQASSTDEAIALAREAQRLASGWLIKNQFSLDGTISLPAAAISCYPQHADKLQGLIETTLHTFERCAGKNEDSIQVTE